VRRERPGDDSADRLRSDDHRGDGHDDTVEPDAVEPGTVGQLHLAEHRSLRQYRLAQPDDVHDEPGATEPHDVLTAVGGGGRQARAG
jgi:hypothetical protein